MICQQMHCHRYGESNNVQEAGAADEDTASLPELLAVGNDILVLSTEM